MDTPHEPPREVLATLSAARCDVGDDLAHDPGLVFDDHEHAVVCVVAEGCAAKLLAVLDLFKPVVSVHDHVYKQVIAMFHAAFDDVSMTVEDEIIEGDKVANQWTFRGTHTGELMGIVPPGNRVEFSAISIHRIAEGRFAGGWVNFDAMGTMQQLGAILAPG